MKVKPNNSLIRPFGISIVCNFFFFIVILYFALFDPPLILRFSPLPSKEGISRASVSLEEVFRTFHLFSYDQLIERLHSDNEVEMGYLEKDLALALLVGEHHFDIKRATQGYPVQKISFRYERDKAIDLYTSLTPPLWEKILSFAQEEIIPFTPEGIYTKIKSRDYSPPLLLAFMQTEEFSLVQTLFSRTQHSVHKGSLFRLLYEGKWENISKFIEQQKKGSDFTSEARQKFLLSFLREKSPTAANLLLLTDRDFALKKLSDADLLLMLSLRSMNTKEALSFAKEVIHSPRKEEVRQKAAFILSRLEPIAAIPSELSNVKNLRPNFRDRPPAAPSPSYHTVQMGETLWTIAQKYQISVEELMQLNRLPSTNIHSGQSLKIP